jgi:predicted ATP-grasp superfamily ATP-dependent carboligase
MKILIFEYLCGGGYCKTALPPSLAREGALMLTALLADFAQLPEHEIIVLQDWRQPLQTLPDNAQVIWVHAEDELDAIFTRALQACDAAWLIVPETGGLLYRFAQQVEHAGKRLLSPSSAAIAKTADKLQTFAILSAHQIATVATQRLDRYDGCFTGAKVVKVRDGVGCEENFFVADAAELTQLRQQLQSPAQFIIQPYLTGETLSLSALFYQGTAQLLCVNRQHIRLKNQRFTLLACEVNVAEQATYQPLVNQIAAAIPELTGYVGIDFIQQGAESVVLEINPRLTSSYAGIATALGINVAQAVLQPLQGAWQEKPVSYQSVTITLTQGD